MIVVTRIIQCTAIVAFMFGAKIANAATWFVFTQAWNSKVLYYFDADSVTKQGDSVTIWEKYYKEKNSPDKDGSYSTAVRTTYSCSKRTTHVLSMSTYDKGGEFMRTYPASGAPTDVIPDTLGDNLLQAVCSPNFPKDTSEKFYLKVKDVSPAVHAVNFYEYLQSTKKTNDPAPQ